MAYVKGTRIEPFAEALKRVFEFAHLRDSATGLSERIRDFITDLNRGQVSDLLPDLVANANRPLFGSRRGFAFLTRVEQQYELKELADVGLVDSDSMIYQFQIDKRTASLAAYFHPIDNREIVFFWIGEADQADRDPTALPWLRDPNLNWRSLSPAYAQWLEERNTGSE